MRHTQAILSLIHIYVNGDGVVDQSDADWIHENQVYELGKTDKRFRMNAMTVYYQAYCIAADGTGNNGELQLSLIHICFRCGGGTLPLLTA